MKLYENKTFYLRENKTGQEHYGCRFRYVFGKDCIRFYFDIKDEEIISPYKEDNEDIWKGDAAEVFISPDGDLTRYKEIEVSPFGVRFYGEVTNEDGKTPRLRKMEPPFKAETKLTEYGYTTARQTRTAKGARCACTQGEADVSAEVSADVPDALAEELKAFAVAKGLQERARRAGGVRLSVRYLRKERVCAENGDRAQLKVGICGREQRFGDHRQSLQTRKEQQGHRQTSARAQGRKISRLRAVQGERRFCGHGDASAPPQHPYR